MRTAILIAITAITILSATAARSQEKQFENKKIEGYSAQVIEAVKLYRAEQDRNCVKLPSPSAEQCVADYEEVLAAVEAERASGVEFLNSDYRVGRKSPVSLKLKAVYVKASEVTTRLMAKVADLYNRAPNSGVTAKK